MEGYDKEGDKRGQAAAAAMALNGTSVAPSLGRRLGVGTGAADIDLSGAGEQLIDGTFGAGDWLLHHGGQLLLDGAGFIPGVNVLTEGIQAGYHALHSGWDAHEGNSSEAKSEAGEAAWHAGLALLNGLTGEGGKVAEGAKAGEAIAEEANVAKTVGEGAEAANTAAHGAEEVSALEKFWEAHPGLEFGLHAFHAVADTTEAAWDLTATMAQMMSGDKEKLPFFGGLAPWIAQGAGRNEPHPEGGEHR